GPPWRPPANVSSCSTDDLRKQALSQLAFGLLPWRRPRYGVHSRANLPEGGDTRRRVVGRCDFRLAHTKFAREDRLMRPSQNRSWQVLIGAKALTIPARSPRSDTQCPFPVPPGHPHEAAPP